MKEKMSYEVAEAIRKHWGDFLWADRQLSLLFTERIPEVLHLSNISIHRRVPLLEWITECKYFHYIEDPNTVRSHQDREG